jgi:cobalt-zinc-cadmium efflux system outer membrane protein
MTLGSRAKGRTPRLLSALWIATLSAGITEAKRVRADTITFDEALALGATTPKVAEPRDMLEARQKGDQKMGGTAEATHLVFMPGALISPSEARGFDMQATITQGWNIRGLAGARRESAAHEREALAATVRARALRTRLAAARRWIDLATITRVAESLDTRISGLEELVAQRERALASGVGTSPEVTAARAMLAELRQHQLEIEGDQFVAATQLAVAIGREPQQDLLETAGDWPDPPLPDEDAIRQRIASVDSAPDVVVEQLRATAARARAIEASAEYGPVFTLGAQGERGALGTWVAYGITGITFRGPGHERRLASVAQAKAAGAAAKTASTKLQVRAELEQALHEVRHSAEVLRLFEEDTLPALQRLVESRERAVALGEESYFAVLEARDRAAAAIEAAHRARGAKTWARIQMWLLLAELGTATSERARP